MPFLCQFPWQQPTEFPQRCRSHADVDGIFRKSSILLQYPLCLSFTYVAFKALEWSIGDENDKTLFAQFLVPIFLCLFSLFACVFRFRFKLDAEAFSTSVLEVEPFLPCCVCLVCFSAYSADDAQFPLHHFIHNILYHTDAI